LTAAPHDQRNLAHISDMLDQMIHVLVNQKVITSRSLDFNKHLVSQELFKMFMKQITCFESETIKNPSNITFTYFLG